MAKEIHVGNPHVPERFAEEVDRHLVLSLAAIEDWPLILGIFGRPGDGKSFQARVQMERRGVQVVSINAADLESDRAGQPGKLVLSKYAEAGRRAEQGNPAALLVDDFDTTVGEWAHSTGTVNHQQVLAQLMHLADSPTRSAEGDLRRVPVLVTGNDLTKVYPPLRRPGRLRAFTWIPTDEERRDTVQALLAGMASPAAVEGGLAACPEAPIAFFADVRTVVLAKAATSEVGDLAGNLRAVVRDVDRSRTRLEATIRKASLTDDQFVQTCSDEWTARQDGDVSHLKD